MIYESDIKPDRRAPDGDSARGKNISGSYESTKTGNSTTQTVRGFVGIGAALGLSQTFDGEIRVGIKVARKVEE